MKHSPINNRILIKRELEKETKTAAGIITSAVSQLSLQEREQVGNKGIILAMGPTSFFEEVNAGFDMPVKVGDRVCFKTTGILSLKHDIDGEDEALFPNCVMILDTDILSKEEKKQ